MGCNSGASLNHTESPVENFAGICPSQSKQQAMTTSTHRIRGRLIHVRSVFRSWRCCSLCWSCLEVAWLSRGMSDTPLDPPWLSYSTWDQSFRPRQTCHPSIFSMGSSDICCSVPYQLRIRKRVQGLEDLPNVTTSVKGEMANKLPEKQKRISTDRKPNVKHAPSLPQSRSNSTGRGSRPGQALHFLVRIVLAGLIFVHALRLGT
ncbi:hypothetical protein K402DRAFT_60393 [Aulographum hederae CBS 113979]|uniref:Uncharacterized protein n=1 Tax=Aulographum hederae CBS 113979 TaxID=1176131 RepID=A0A6G1H1N8_9PEZI|nr:hypothetical protein K402DRAFT_60393 [Aulographum hederae CBS 113979]